jgi:hypothetical protein
VGGLRVDTESTINASNPIYDPVAGTVSVKVNRNRFLLRY